MKTFVHTSTHVPPSRSSRVHAIGPLVPLTVGNRISHVSIKQLPASRASSSSHERFHDVFGPLGIPMALCFAFAAAVSFSFAAMQLFPLRAMNLLMDTSDLDNGHFWFPVTPPHHVVIPAASTLVAFGLGYLSLILYMLPLSLFATASSNTTILAPVIPPSSSSKLLIALERAVIKRARTATSRVVALNSEATSAQDERRTADGDKQSRRTGWQRLCDVDMREFTSFTGTYHHYYVVLFDMPKLAFQSVNLSDFLAQGFPLHVIQFYAALLASNWLIAVYRFQRRDVDRKCIVTRMSLLFDLFFAVFAPFVVLVYAYCNFHFDRDVFRARQETMTPGAFGRVARLFADPVEIVVFHLGFENLQLLTLERVFIKSFLNIMGMVKWRQIIAHLRCVADEDWQKATHSTPDKYYSRHHIWVVASACALVLSGFAVAITTAIASSNAMCAPHPQCRLISYNWRGDSDALCPCLVYIDRDIQPRTFSEWMNPPDTTAELAHVAKAGYLLTVQIINRKLVELPIELLESRNLRHLILIYTQTKRIPDWAKQFAGLVYLHIEVNVVKSDLEYLPPDLFTDMTNLDLIRIGRATRLTQFPSLVGLHHLTTFILSGLYDLRALPSFDDLTALTTLFVIDMTHVPTLPSLRNLKSLTSFSLIRRNEMCCNGFITGKCDLTDFQCKPRTGEPLVECIDDRIATDDLALISRANGVVCSKNVTIDLAEVDVTPELSDGACGGVLYKQCNVNGHRGMCYNSRMQVIACNYLGEVEAMRRLEIARGIGDSCDPAVEAWLGCRSQG